ncbi:hypothetical protein LCGC14_1566150 [marine sediment metagenome]|uniref:Uncharacterized protein n=1 Tax=marine sediment metagenome TaxID=412755 RepID=A0A0F9J780_9ZZZZ
MATATQDNEALILEMLRDAKDTDVHSELESNLVIHKGDETLEAPMTIKEMTNAGYKSVWNTETREWAPVLSYMLPGVLRQKRPDGKFMWTTAQPTKPPDRGTLKCLLHEDSPGREEFNRMGLRVCGKSNITNEFEVKQHMMMKHSKEWKSIEDGRLERERQEDRTYQKTLIEAIGGREEKAPLYVSKKDREKESK